MSVRETSIEAWERLLADNAGRLKKLHLTALGALWEVYPRGLTGKEVDKKHGSDTYHKRMSELADLGVATEFAEGVTPYAPGSEPVKRTCTATPITENHPQRETAVEWRATFAPIRSKAERKVAKETRRAWLRARRATREARREEQLIAVVAALRAYTTGDLCTCAQQSMAFVPRERCRFCVGIEALRQVAT